MFLNLLVSMCCVVFGGDTLDVATVSSRRNTAAASVAPVQSLSEGKIERLGTIGLHEAESPFFGPNSDDVLTPGMTVCVDVSFFGHPEFNGARIETGFLITEDGAKPFSPKMDAIHSAEL